jgi:hypothetical protein
MLVTKDTQESRSGFFAVADIDARARAAYMSNRKLFDNPEHRARCERVEQILRGMVLGFRSIYQTARPTTRNRPAHTEVKVDRAEQYAVARHRVLREQAVQELAAMGLDLVYKPRTNSYSVHVA